MPYYSRIFSGSKIAGLPTRLNVSKHTADFHGPPGDIKSMLLFLCSLWDLQADLCVINTRVRYNILLTVDIIR